MKPKVLLLMENADLREIYGTMLRHHHYEVVEATDLAAAVAALENASAAAVVIDGSLLEEDGRKAVAELRRKPGAARAPFVLLCPPEEPEGPLAGSNLYRLAKPVEPRQLLWAVAGMLREAGGKGGSVGASG